MAHFSRLIYVHMIFYKLAILMPQSLGAILSCQDLIPSTKNFLNFEVLAYNLLVLISHVL